MIELPRMGRITQGTIFCGGCATGYKGEPTWGLVITARCDTAQEKVVVVNYLPVVRIEDWLTRHGGLLVLEHALADLQGRLKGLLKKRAVSESVLKVYSPSEIASQYFPLFATEPTNNKEKAERTDALLAASLASELEVLKTHLDQSRDDEPLPRQLFDKRNTSIRAIVLELISHKLSGFYFLPTLGDLTEHPSTLGYVVLLREIRSVRRTTTSLIMEGMRKDDCPEGEAGTGVTFEKFDFLYPIAQIRSPWVEHILQVFCTMFGRIGVEDPDKSQASVIAESAFKSTGSY